MPRFARMLGEGMAARGHEIQYWTSKQQLSSRRQRPDVMRKWLGYVDQFVIYPFELATKVRNAPPETLFVVTDQALGMWVPAIKERRHVVHCHDFLALRSAAGEFPENPTGFTGKQYQRLIRRGFSQAKNFISVSQRTQLDLHQRLSGTPVISKVVYNGLNDNFHVMSRQEAETVLESHLTAADRRGFLLHVGGNQWYKNRLGVIELYRAWIKQTDEPLPLWMIGEPPTRALTEAAGHVPPEGAVRFLSGLPNESIIAAYNLAKLVLFPSLEEGFGWPIAEAMACGTLVLTTDRAPMTEVGGEAAYYLPRLNGDLRAWASHGAKVMADVLNLSDATRQARTSLGLLQVKQFAPQQVLDAYEAVYQEIVDVQ